MHAPGLKEIGRRGRCEFGASIRGQLIGDSKCGEGLPQYTDQALGAVSCFRHDGPARISVHNDQVVPA